MSGSPVDKPDRDFSAGYAILQSQEPLPPYGLDPRFDDPLTRKRIGEVIARGMEQQVTRRYRRQLAAPQISLGDYSPAAPPAASAS